MKKLALTLGVVFAVFLGSYRVVLSHCEIPCGIYGDPTRIALLYEDIATVEKSMQQIVALSQENPPNANQVARWVTNKEDHASKIQHTVTQYFMTQRIKPAKASDAEAHKKYVTQLTLLHQMLVHAMKSKQTTDTMHTAKLRELVDAFSEAYFSPADLKHLRAHHGKH